MAKMVDIVEKCKNRKRKRVNWLKIMQQYGNAEIEHDFISRISKLRRGKCMSLKRCAYYSLKAYYSTTTIDELLEKVGV